MLPVWPWSEGGFEKVDDVPGRQQLQEGQIFRFFLNFLLEAPEPEEALDRGEDVEAEDGGHHAGVADCVEENSAEGKSQESTEPPEEAGESQPGNSFTSELSS